ncbi:hypothetical protein GGI43DRAFT_183160 [Trichoderma evansii]
MQPALLSLKQNGKEQEGKKRERQRHPPPMVRDFAIAANLFNGDKHPRPLKQMAFCFAFLILGLAFADICTSLIGHCLQAMRDPEHRSRARHRQNLEPNAAITWLRWATPSLFFCSVEHCRVIAAWNCDSRPVFPWAASGEWCILKRNRQILLRGCLRDHQFARCVSTDCTSDCKCTFFGVLASPGRPQREKAFIVWR